MMKKTLASIVVVGLCCALSLTWIGFDPFGAKAEIPTGMLAFDPISLQSPASVVDVNSLQERGRVGLDDHGADDDGPKIETGSLRIKITNVAGEPVPMVGVTIHPQGGREREMSLFTGVTDREGLVHIDMLAPGEAKIHLDRMVQAVMQISSGEASDIEITIPDAVTVRGRVVGSQGEPISKASLWVRLNTVTQIANEVGRADENGLFVLKGMPAYASFIGATMEGYAPSVMEIVRGKAGDVQELRIMLSGSGARVRGLVLDEDGRPVEGALLRLGGRRGGSDPRRNEDGIWRKGWAPRRIRSDDCGMFSLDGLAAEEVEFLVQARGFRPFNCFFALLPNFTTEVTIRLEKGARLRGRVLGSEGMSVSQAEIEVEGLGHHMVQRSRSDSSGRYELDGLDPRRMKLTIIAAGYVTATRELRAEAGAALEIDIQLHKAGVLRGQILDPYGRPLAGWLIRTEHNRDHNSVDRWGRFAVPVGNLAKTRVWIVPPMIRSAILCDWLGEVSVSAEELVIHVPKDRLPSAQIRGRMLDAEGVPRQGVVLDLNQDGFFVMSAWIDPGDMVNSCG